jgi:hypothetical protein
MGLCRTDDNFIWFLESEKKSGCTNINTHYPNTFVKNTRDETD